MLVEAIVLARVEQGQLEQSVLREWLDASLGRAEDRALFDLDGSSSERCPLQVAIRADDSGTPGATASLTGATGARSKRPRVALESKALGPTFPG